MHSQALSKEKLWWQKLAPQAIVPKDAQLPEVTLSPWTLEGRGRVCVFSQTTSSFLPLFCQVMEEPIPHSEHTFLSSWRDFCLLGRESGGHRGHPQGRGQGACLINKFLHTICFGCILAFNLHYIRERDGHGQTRKLRLKEDCVHSPMAEPRRGSKAPTLNRHVIQTAMPRSDEASANLKVQIRLEQLFTGGLLGARH